MTARSAILAVAVLASATAAAPSSADDVPLRRWGVVSTPGVQQSGVSDLLTSELATIAGVELVERDQLAAATRELELSALLSTEGCARRLQLGKQLRADALVLLTVGEQGGPTERDKTRQLRVIICECRYGARLLVADLHWTSRDKPAELARTAAALVRRACEQYRNGVQAIVGVPPLISDNLGHGFDHLQSAYAELIGNALTARSGIAVLELAEAQSIGRELDRAGDQLAGRRVPLFVEGRFQMSTLVASDNVRVKLNIRVSDSQGEKLRLNEEALTMDAAVQLLSTTLPARVLKLAKIGGAGTLSLEAQHARLVARAGEFNRLADWRHAIELHEAALLLKPDDDASRILLAVEISELLRADGPPEYALQKRGILTQDQRQPLWESYVRHVEALIDRRAVSPLEADLLVLEAVHQSNIPPCQGIEPWRKKTPQDMAHLSSQAQYWTPPRSVEIRQKLDAFFRQVYPKFPRLDPKMSQGAVRDELAPICRAAFLTLTMRTGEYIIVDPHRKVSAAEQQAVWSGGMIYNVWAAVRPSYNCALNSPDFELSDGRISDGRHFDTRFYYETIFWLLTNVQLNPYQVRLPPTLTSYYPTAEDDRRMDALAARLKQVGRPELTFVARRLILERDQERFEERAIEFGSTHGDAAPQPAKLAAERDRIASEITSLAQFVTSTGYKSPKRRPPAWDPLADLKRFEREFQKGLAPGDTKAKGRIPQLGLRQPQPLTTGATGVQLPFLPHDTRGYINCSNRFDLTWNARRLRILRAKDRAELFFELDRWPQQDAPKDTFSQTYGGDQFTVVQWDGKYVWLASKMAGIKVLDESGRVVARWTEKENLPDGAALIYPQGAGRCLVIGLRSTPSEADRSWIARLEYRDGAAQGVQMLLSATKTFDKTDALDQAFRPGWMMVWHAPQQPEKPVLLVGRGALELNHHKQRRPLSIDLATFEISVSPARFPDLNPERFASFHELPDHRILVPDWLGVVVVSPPPPGGDKWPWKALSKRLAPQDIRMITAIQYGEKWLLPGEEKWQLFDPATNAVSEYPVDRETAQWSKYSTSAHYGLVGYELQNGSGSVGEGPVYRIQLKNHRQETEEEYLARNYSFMAPEARVKHARAKAAIEKLGGRVGLYGPNWSPVDMGVWSTGVELTDQWRGGDEGLKWLKDLHRVSILHLIRAPITREGMKTIGECNDLRALLLFETPLTDRDLAPLAGLRQLTHLRLEGTAGGKEFSDAAFDHFQNLPLQRLTVYGKGFTAATFHRAMALPRLNTLRLFNTAVSGEVIATWKQENPNRERHIILEYAEWW